MQHSPNVELLQLWPAPSCQVGCPLCAQDIIAACKNMLTSREHFHIPLLAWCLCAAQYTDTKQAHPHDIDDPKPRPVRLYLFFYFYTYYYNNMHVFIICDRYVFFMQQHGLLIMHFIRGIYLGSYNGMYACFTSHGTYSLTR
jgi:hypothetical protein